MWESLAPTSISISRAGTSERASMSEGGTMRTWWTAPSSACASCSCARSPRGCAGASACCVRSVRAWSSSGVSSPWCQYRLQRCSRPSPPAPAAPPRRQLQQSQLDRSGWLASATSRTQRRQWCPARRRQQASRPDGVAGGRRGPRGGSRAPAERRGTPGAARGRADTSCRGRRPAAGAWWHATIVRAGW